MPGLDCLNKMGDPRSIRTAKPIITNTGTARRMAIRATIKSVDLFMWLSEGSPRRYPPAKSS